MVIVCRFGKPGTALPGRTRDGNLEAMNDPIIDRKIHWLARRIARAQRQFALFEAGDRVLVAFSGGKDSLALLHALPAWAHGSALALTIEAVHVEVVGGASHREALAAMAVGAGVPLAFTSFVPDPSGPGPDGRLTHPCFRCSRLRREALLRYALDGRWQALALGHHLDDDAETVLMNQVFQGVSKGLRPRRDYADGSVRVVRPLIMAEEREVAALARLLAPVAVACACPDGRSSPPHSARQQMKEFLRGLGPRGRAAKRHLQRIGQSPDGHSRERT